MTKDSAADGRLTLGLAFSCFAAQGIANGMLGVAWPSIRATFGLSLDVLVVLFISSTIGYLIGSIMAGRAMNQLGIGRSLLIGNLVAAAGFFGYALSPGWWIMVVLAILVGWTSGSIGASLNIFVAATRTVRAMNWMHAMYGVGATIGPLIMTAAIGSRFGWRLGYMVAGAIHLTLALLFLTVVDRMNFRGMPVSLDRNGVKNTASPAATLRLPIVLLGIALFLLYTGVETTAGQWSFSLFTEERSMSLYLAGISTSIYWGMLTLGRILFGAVANRIGINRLLRYSMAGAVLSAALLLIPTPSAGIISLALMGLSLSAIFPTLMSDTPNRVGAAHVSSAIGFQTGASSLGLALLPGVAGVLAARLGLEVIGFYLVLASLLMLITNEVAIHLAHRNRMSADSLVNSGS